MRQGRGARDGYTKRSMDWYYYREILYYMMEWRTMKNTQNRTDLVLVNWSSYQHPDKDGRGAHGSARSSWGKELDGMAERW